MHLQSSLASIADDLVLPGYCNIWLLNNASSQFVSLLSCLHHYPHLPLPFPPFHPCEEEEKKKKAVASDS